MCRALSTRIYCLLFWVCFPRRLSCFARFFFPRQVQEQLRFLPQVKRGGISAPAVATASPCTRKKQKQNVVFICCCVPYCCKSVSVALKTVCFAGVRALVHRAARAKRFRLDESHCCCIVYCSPPDPQRNAPALARRTHALLARLNAAVCGETASCAFHDVA